MSNMLTKYQVHKENYDHVHIEFDTTKFKDDHDQTLNEFPRVCATKRKEHILTTPKDKSGHIKELCDVEHVDVVKSRNFMIFVVGDGNIHDCLSPLGTIRLSLRL